MRPRGSLNKKAGGGPPEVNTLNQLKPWNKGQHAVVVAVSVAGCGGGAGAGGGSIGRKGREEKGRERKGSESRINPTCVQ